MFFFRKRRKKPVVCNTHPNISSENVLTGAAVSDIGCLRENNEDNFILVRQINETCANSCEAVAESRRDPWFFAGVFDGMGGGEKGEIAALSAAQVFRHAIGQLPSDTSEGEADRILREAFLDANNKIIDMNDSRIYGTTGTVLAVHASAYKIYHLGDSRAYLFRDGQLLPLTRDQTLAQMKIDVGLYTADDPQAEADKHKLTEYIGKDQTRQHLCPVESGWIPGKPGDRLLLCSDGLYDMCTDQQILEILSQSSDVFCNTKALVSAARDNGGVDNVTCVLVAYCGNSQ